MNPAVVAVVCCATVAAAVAAAAADLGAIVFVSVSAAAALFRRCVTLVTTFSLPCTQLSLCAR